MEIGFCNIFTSYEMEVEKHVYVQIENQQGFHELQWHARIRVDKL